MESLTFLLWTHLRQKIMFSGEKKSWKRLKQMLLSNRHIQEANSFKVCEIIKRFLWFTSMSLSRYTHLNLWLLKHPYLRRSQNTHNQSKKSTKHNFKWSQTWIQTRHRSFYTSFGQVFTASHSSNYLIFTKCPNCQFRYVKLHMALGK